MTSTQLPGNLVVVTNSVLKLPDDIRMLDVVCEGLAFADDVRIAVSFTRCNGPGLLVDPIKEVAARGGRIIVLTSTYQSITQPATLDTPSVLPGERRVAVIATTGVGKRFLPAFDVVQSGARNALYVSHRLEHLTQGLWSFGRVPGLSHTTGLVGGLSLGITCHR